MNDHHHGATVPRRARVGAFAIALAALASAGCGARSEYRPDSTDGYHDRPALTRSLFAGDQGTMDEATLARVLDSRAPMRPRVNIAVLPLDGWCSDHPGFAATIQERFAAAVKPSGRVAGITRIPSLVLPQDQRGMGAIREACARLQCDLVLLYTIRQRIHVDGNVFTRDEAKAWSTIEAVLVDVRTGLVPWADLVDSEVAGQETDDSSARHIAMLAAAHDATGRVAEDLGRFFAKAPAPK